MAPQLSETEKIRFYIGTQSLKQANNQVHLVEFDEENSTLKTAVYYHPQGEIWKLNSSPLNSSLIASCFNTVNSENTCSVKSAVMKVPEITDPDKIENLDIALSLNSPSLIGDVKTTEFHSIDENKMACVSDNQLCLWEVRESVGVCVLSIQLEGKNNPKFTTGKWNPHQNCNQVNEIPNSIEELLN